jgi:hypothetical protein
MLNFLKVGCGVRLRRSSHVTAPSKIHARSINLNSGGDAKSLFRDYYEWWSNQAGP